MVARKRGRQEQEEDAQRDAQHNEPDMLHRLRNMWEFASLMQYIQLFGKVIRVDDNLDIDELEALCIDAPNSTKLMDVGLALLKFVSSHRGLTLDLFNEYTRRQYQTKLPQQNPFGKDEAPNDFSDFDIFTKIRVLHRLSVWTLDSPDRIRERLPGKEYDQTLWRMEPLGWDGEGRVYYVLDDNRLYRRTDLPIPTHRAKSQAKRSSSTGANKKRKTSTGAKIGECQTSPDDHWGQGVCRDYDGMKWECVAISLDDYTTFMQTIRRSRGQEEKALHSRLIRQVMPIIERRAEEQRRKAIKRQKQLDNMEKLATAKRSSRIAGKMERKKQQDEAEETERKRVVDLANAKKEEQRLRDLDDAQKSRMVTREQRLKEREMKRILHEEELSKLEKSKQSIEDGSNRMSERHYEAEMRRRQDELEQIRKEGKLIFDCSVCGTHGDKMDDGLHSIACENCNIWQHGECHNIKLEDAVNDNFHFLCAFCKQQAEDAQKPKIAPIRIHLGKSMSLQEPTSLKVDASSPAKLTEHNHINGVSFPHDEGSLNALHLTNTREVDQMPVLQYPKVSQDYGSFGLNMPTRTPSSFPIDEPSTNGGKMLKSEEDKKDITTGAALHFNNPSVAIDMLPQQPHFEPVQNISVSNDLYQSSARPSNEPQQSSSSPSGKLNGHSSPVRLPPPSTPNGLHIVHFNAIGDSPVKHAPSSITQTPAEIITGVISGFSPTKHDSPRPSSACSISRAHVIPPVANLSPKASPMIMTPPSKKMVSSPPAQVISSPHASKG